MRGDGGWSFLVVFFACAGFYFGYHYPRDEEIESTKPIVLHYEITPEAARALMFKYSEGIDKCPTEPNQ